MKHEDDPPEMTRTTKHRSRALARYEHKSSTDYGIRARRARAIGAVAIGALALGAVAVGALAIGRLSVKSARVRRLEVDELIIRRQS